MNLHEDTASLELRAAAFREHGHCAIADLVPEDVVELIKLTGCLPSYLTVEAGGVLRNTFHTDSPAPNPNLCTRTFEQVRALGGRPCSSCKRQAWAHNSEADTDDGSRNSPDLSTDAVAETASVAEVAYPTNT